MTEVIVFVTTVSNLYFEQDGGGEVLCFKLLFYVFSVLFKRFSKFSSKFKNKYVKENKVNSVTAFDDIVTIAITRTQFFRFYSIKEKFE